jgi:hypothetical protein
MKLSGIIDFSMNNFLCIRGFAPIKDLFKSSKPHPDVQRDLIEKHKGEMAKFLNSGDYTFFPEVILATTLSDGTNFEEIEKFREMVKSQDGFNGTINDFKFSVSVNKTKSPKEARMEDLIKTAHVHFEENEKTIYRIDGNHRLSAAEESEFDYNTPFCLLLFRTQDESDRFSRAIFHNINSKQIPLELEHNLKVIIDGEAVFTDSTLKDDPSFGIHYYLARKLLKKIDFTYFPLISASIQNYQYTYFIELFKYLIKCAVIPGDDSGIEIVMCNLNDIEQAIRESQITIATNNVAVLGAMSYYIIVSKDKYSHFTKWIKKNNIGTIENLTFDNVIEIYDKIYSNAPRKVFLARWYPGTTDPEATKAKHRFDAIKEIVESLNLELVDMGTQITGTFDIRTVMYSAISDCDIFIADLTGARHNVMVEVGYALKHINSGRVVFYFQACDACPAVPFDLSGFAYDAISDSREIAQKTKSRIEKILEQVKNGEL